MQIRVKLMGGLKAKSPDGGTLDVPDQTSINAVLDALDIDPKAVQVVMVNSKPQGDRNHVVADGDELTILPPVGGG